MLFSKTRYLIRKRAIGDVLWIEPLIRQLSIRHSQVIVNSKYNELFINYPLKNVKFVHSLSLFHKINLRIHQFFKWDFKYINLDNAYENLPEMHVLHAYQTKAKMPITYEYPRIYLKEKDNNTISRESYVILHLETSSTRNYRNVYGVNWEEVVNYLINNNISVLQIGLAPNMIAGADYKATKTITDLINIVDGCKFFIGIDSGPSHIAASLGKKSLLFFGAINPWFRHFKLLFKGMIMQSPCEFQNCYHTQKSTNGPSCRIVGDTGIPKCSLFTTQDVIQNIKKIIESD